MSETERLTDENRELRLTIEWYERQLGEMTDIASKHTSLAREFADRLHTGGK